MCGNNIVITFTYYIIIAHVNTYSYLLNTNILYIYNIYSLSIVKIYTQDVCFYLWQSWPIVLTTLTSFFRKIIV